MFAWFTQQNLGRKIIILWNAVFFIPFCYFQYWLLTGGAAPKDGKSGLDSELTIIASALMCFFAIFSFGVLWFLTKRRK